MNWALRRYRWFLRILTALYWMGLATLTHLPPSRLPHTHVSDKVAHFTVYAILSVLLFLCLWSSGRSTRVIAGTVLAIALAFGAIDEWTQPFFDRTCDIRDWCADAAGAGTAIIVMSALASATRSSH